jgi:DNA-binding GntR family transcriptional regulator
MSDNQEPLPPPGYAYVHLAERIRGDIRAGRIRVGAMLGGERRLADEYGVSTKTVRAALAILRDEGIVETYPYKGTFVVAAPKA